MTAKQTFTDMLKQADVVINGSRPWDPQIHNDDVFRRILAGGSIAAGESYMDGWWDVDDMSELFSRMQKHDFADDIAHTKVFLMALKEKLFNRQNKERARIVGKEHYDIGNDLYKKMLDKRMVYTCAYWKDAQTLDEAQEAKLDLVCKKIGLKKGDRVLDIGGGWGSFAKFAYEKYGAETVAITISEEQAKLGKELTKGMPIEIRVQDYRDVSDGPYDHIVSIGMFEHVGFKNYRTFMKKAQELLSDDGLFLLHTIGANQARSQSDPWIDKYIFPNGILPPAVRITRAMDGLFQLEDWHNFGPDYDKTTCAWFENFDAAWITLKDKYDERFYRMWRYYLLHVAGGFRARKIHLWQIVLSKNGVPGGYVSIR